MNILLILHVAEELYKKEIPVEIKTPTEQVVVFLLKNRMKPKIQHCEDCIELKIPRVQISIYKNSFKIKTKDGTKAYTNLNHFLATAKKLINYKPLHLATVSEKNKNTIIKLYYTNTTRKDIAEKLNLPIGRIDNIINNYVEEKIIQHRKK